MGDEDWDDWSSTDEPLTSTTDEPNPPLQQSLPSPPPPVTRREISVGKLSDATLSKLQDYRLDIGSQSLREMIGFKLARYSEASFDKLRDYYVREKKLARYTLRSEIERMSYKITTKSESIVLSTTEAIREHFGDGVDDDIFSYFGLDDDNDDNLLWRASNQSLLGDIVSILSGTKDVIRPHLGASASADKVSFHINFAAGFVNVVGQFKVVIDELEIALFTVSLYLNFGDRELRVALEDLRPVLVTDDALRLASLKIASDKFALGELDDLRELQGGSQEDSLAALRDVINSGKEISHKVVEKINSVDGDELKYRAAESVAGSREGFVGALRMMDEATGIGKTAGKVGGGVVGVAGGLWGGLRGLGIAIRSGAEQLEAQMNEEASRIDAEEKRLVAEQTQTTQQSFAAGKEIGEQPSSPEESSPNPAPVIQLYRATDEDDASMGGGGEEIKLRSLFGGAVSGILTNVKNFTDKIVNEIDESVNNVDENSLPKMSDNDKASPPPKDQEEDAIQEEEGETIVTFEADEESTARMVESIVQEMTTEKTLTTTAESSDESDKKLEIIETAAAAAASSPLPVQTTRSRWKKTKA